MARPKYRITGEDVQHAKRYLSRQLETSTWYIIDSKQFDEYFDRYVKVKKAYDNIERYSLPAELSKKERDKMRAEKLNQWADKWLEPAHWDKLKTGIKKRRARLNNKIEGKKERTLTVNHQAKIIVTTLAKENNMTLSEYLVSKLEPDYIKLMKKKHYR